MKPTNAPKQDLMKALMDRATRDREFRRALLTDPKAAVYRYFGVQIPDSFNIRFIERDPELDALVVLPPFDETSSEELSDDDLDIVVGGARHIADIRGVDFRWSE